MLRPELDAWCAHVYCLTEERLHCMLSPAKSTATTSPARPSPGLKQKEERQFGEFRTRRLVLEAWQRLDIRSSDSEL